MTTDPASDDGRFDDGTEEVEVAPGVVEKVRRAKNWQYLPVNREALTQGYDAPQAERIRQFADAISDGAKTLRTTWINWYFTGKDWSVDAFDIRQRGVSGQQLDRPAFPENYNALEDRLRHTIFEAQQAFPSVFRSTKETDIRVNLTAEGYQRADEDYCLNHHPHLTTEDGTANIDRLRKNIATRVNGGEMPHYFKQGYIPRGEQPGTAAVGAA